MVTPGVKVIRSVSDVIALNIEKVDSSNDKDYLSLESSSTAANPNNQTKISTNEHQSRRNSAESTSAAHKTRQNRLLLLKKRHSGFHLRRPEILETVYSVSHIHISSINVLNLLISILTSLRNLNYRLKRTLKIQVVH